jgi:hypothetical protein
MAKMLDLIQMIRRGELLMRDAWLSPRPSTRPPAQSGNGLCRLRSRSFL